jgi:hypothetical protein
VKGAADRGACVMGAARPPLNEIVRMVSETQRPIGLLLYGSYGSEESYAGSDVDLICVTGTGRGRHYTVNVAGVTADVYANTRPSLEQLIRSDKSSNNNFVLYAFAHGRPLLDRDGGTEALMRLAAQIWEAGPSQPGPDERQAIATAIRKSLAAAAKFVKRAEGPPEWREMAHIDVGQLFVQTVYAYCRVHRLWASSLWRMFKWDDPKYADLLAMCKKYLRAQTFEERAAALTDIADLSLARIEAASARESFRA